MAEGDRWVRIQTAEGAEYEVLESRLAELHPDATALGYVGIYGNLEPIPETHPHARRRQAAEEKPA